MFNPDTAPVSALMPSLETAAAALKIAPITAPVHGDAEIETAIIALGREPGGGLCREAASTCRTLGVVSFERSTEGLRAPQFR
jgi:hypothetical protein